MSYRRGRHRSSNVRWNFLMSVDTVLGGITYFILLHEKLLQFDWLRAVVFRLNLKYVHVKIRNLLWVVV